MEISAVKLPPLFLGERGVLMAEAQITLPRTVGEDKASCAVNHFYDRIGDALERIAREVLLPISRELYEKSDDPRKRLTHRPFRLLCECALSAVGEGMLVKRTVTVRHRGRVIFERCDHEIVCNDGLILPWKEKSPK